MQFHSEKLDHELVVIGIRFPSGVNDFEAGGAVKLGTSKAAGSITSRAINLSGNGRAFTLSFKVKGWSTREGDIKVTAGAQSQTVTYAATMLPIKMTVERATSVFVMTVIMCVTSGAIAMRKLQTADPADIF